VGNGASRRKRWGRAIEDVEMAEISPADGNNFLMARIAATGLLG
jgi:hypothetical protein